MGWCGLTVLVTGGAGFIGAAIAHRLLDQGERVFVIDNLNDYYAVSLKQARLDRLLARENVDFAQTDLVDRSAIAALFQQHRFDVVVNLAAQAGVRYSIERPEQYIDANLLGFGNILEGCRQHRVAHLVYASSSSVYGNSTRLPLHEDDPVDQPVSLYAASKKSNELMAHCYAHLYRLRCTGLRFFTAYGPWGRPDMAFFKFTRMILNDETIPVFNHGKLARDFTYIDDIVEAVSRVMHRTPTGRYAAASGALHRIYNIGNGRQINLMDYIKTLEKCLGRTASYEMLPMQDGDVYATQADISRLAAEFDFRPDTEIAQGLARFVAWYTDYYDHQ